LTPINFTPAAVSGANCPSVHVALPQAQPFAGQSDERLSAPSDTRALDSAMTDEEREAAAYRAGVAMHAWYSQFQQTGDMECLDNAYRALGLMRQLLAGRSPEYVAKLEQERGLS
jgi:hypothetical protein